MGIMRTLTINGEKFNVTPVVPASSVTLLASAWVGEGDSYSQVVELSGVTSHTKVDLQPTPEQLEEFHYLTLAFVAENDGGVVTVYAIGDKPTGDHTIQTTLTEVEREGKIRGNTVGTTVPRTDFDQTDPTQADYLKGREKIVQSVNGVAPDENGNVEVSGGGSGSGTDGEDGATFTPSVDADGNLSWTNDKGLDNPETVNIKGPQGETGPQGEAGEFNLPTFDLSAMGLPAITPDDAAVSLTGVDLTDLGAALEAGPVKFSFLLNIGQEITMTAVANATAIPSEGLYQWVIHGELNGTILTGYFQFAASSGTIKAWATTGSGSLLDAEGVLF